MTENRHLSQRRLVWGSELDQARAAVLAIHGRGQSPEFMQQQADRLTVSGLRFYASSAADSSWYPKPFLEPLENNQPDLSHALEALAAQVAAVEAEGFTRDRIVFWGFSQGACLVSHYILSCPIRYAGLILFTGGYLGPEALPSLDGRPLDGVPALLRSIENDPWVPKIRVEQTATILQDAGCDVDIHIAPGNEHVITDEAMAAAAEMLNGIAS